MQLVCFLPSLLPRLCRLPLPQTPTVVPISVTSSCSWSIWTLYRLRQSSGSRLGPTKTQCYIAQVQRFVLHGWPSQEPKGGVQQNWRRQELGVQDVCVLWGARVVIPPPGRERVIQELREIHVHSGIAKMKSLARSCVWWVSLDADLEPKCEPIPSVSQVDPRVVPRPFHMYEKEGLSGFSCHMERVSSPI